MKLPKIKKDKLNIIYWTIAVVSMCILILTDVDYNQILALALGTGVLIKALFDKDFSKKYFE